MQKNNSDCSGVAQHALVLGPSDHVQSDPTEPALLAQPVNTALQSDPSLEPHQSRSRATLKQWQQELRLPKEDQPDQSMRQVDHFYKLVPH